MAAGVSELAGLVEGRGVPEMEGGSIDGAAGSVGSAEALGLVLGFLDAFGVLVGSVDVLGFLDSLGSAVVDGAGPGDLLDGFGEAVGLLPPFLTGKVREKAATVSAAQQFCLRLIPMAHISPGSHSACFLHGTFPFGLQVQA